MNNFKIYASDVLLDTFEENDISLNYKIQDILDVTKRNSPYSKTITIPGTPSNNEFFEQIFDVNVDNEFNVNLKIPGRIVIGNSEVFRGDIRLISVNVDNKRITYEIQFNGILRDILSSVKDYNLRDLDLSEFDHIRNQNTINPSWEYNVSRHFNLEQQDGPGLGYVYPYIINGNSPDFSTNLYIYDLYPSPYIKTIFDRIFDFAGFSYTSKFINSEYFRKLIMPYTGEKLMLSEEQIKEKKVIAGVPSFLEYQQLMYQMPRGSGWYYNDMNSIPYYIGLTREDGIVDDSGSELEFMDLSDQWDGNAFICSKAGRYNVRMDGKLIPVVYHDNGNNVEFSSGQFGYRYQLLLFKASGGVIELDSSKDDNDPIWGVQQFGLSSGVHPTPWYDIGTNLVFAMSAEDIFLSPGDRIVVKFGFNYPSTVNWQGTGQNKHKVALTLKQSLNGDFTKFTVTPSDTASLGNELIQMSQTLPDRYKMDEFLLDLFKMFNLVVMDNPEKEGDLLIEPYDDFFAGKRKVKDWNHILDNDSTVKIIPMSEVDSKSYIYKYADDDDFFNKAYRDEFSESFGQIRIDVQNDFSSKINDFELKFASTPNADRNTAGIVCPYFVQDSDSGWKQKTVKPRILFYGGLKNCSTLSYRAYPDATPIDTLVQYPYCGMWDDPYEPEYDLGFGKTRRIYWDTISTTNMTLFEKFHRGLFNSITDINARLLEASFQLTEREIEDFDFRDVIFLMGSYWRVNSIQDYNPTGNKPLTKVKLYKIVDLDFFPAIKVEVPESSVGCPDDVEIQNTLNQLFYVSASGKIITEDCCTQYGGRWVDGACRARRFIGWVPRVPINLGNAPGPSEPTASNWNSRGNNSVNQNGSLVVGTGNYVPPRTRPGQVILGSDSTIGKVADGTFVIGDGVNATLPNTVYLGNYMLDSNGNIMPSGINILDGGLDEVFNFNKTNLIDIVDGGYESVRNPNGASKARPIISGNEDEIL
jgi:hypothetical protein